jgi:NitT/TauT family transport system substrate-binding protein
MPSAWVAVHKAETQKLANAFVKTLRYIATHSAEQIADKMPADYYAGNKPLYIKALIEGKGMFTPDGKMPENGPKTVLTVLNAFDKAVQGKTIDIGRTYTTQFVDTASKTIK